MDTDLVSTQRGWSFDFWGGVHMNKLSFSLQVYQQNKAKYRGPEKTLLSKNYSIPHIQKVVKNNCVHFLAIYTAAIQTAIRKPWD